MKKNISVFRLSCVLLLAFLTMNCGRPTQSDQPAQAVYDRVIRAGTIRAAYVNYPPGLIIDPKTKQLSGIFFDLLNRISSDAKLKVIYTEEVGWATLVQGLEAGRYDVIGSPVWSNPVRGKVATLTKAVYYTGVGVWVRSDETRIKPDQDWAALNHPSIRIAAMDGSTPMLIVKSQFPQAQIVSYPDSAGEPQLFLDLTSKKADVFFAEPAQGIAFLKTHPGSVKNLAVAAPLRLFANTFMLKRGEWDLKHMLDTGIDDLQNSGFVDALLKKYEPGPNAFYRVAQPYQAPIISDRQK